MTPNIQLAPHVQDITRALDGKVSPEQIERELKEYTNVYQLPLVEAKRNIVKKYSGDVALLRTGEEKAISEITLKDKFVDVIGLVRSINTKDVVIKNENRTLHYGLLMGAGGSSISFTAWDDPKVERGDLIKIHNSRITIWRERPQLNINGSLQVKKLEMADHPEFKPENIRNESKIENIIGGDSYIAVQGLIIDAERRESTRDDDSKLVFYSGTIGDETGMLPFTSWRDQVISPGDFLIIENAYAREWRSQPQLVINDSSTVTKGDLPEDFPSVEDIQKPKRMRLMELERHGGGNNVIVTGALLDVKKNSGLIMRCPECKRVVQKGSCILHGEVEGEPDLRIKGVLDDGSAAISVVLGRVLTEKLLGMPIEECQEIARKKMDASIIQEKLEDKLLTCSLTILGNVLRDDYGLTMLAREASLTETNVIEEAEVLIQETEVVE